MRKDAVVLVTMAAFTFALATIIFVGVHASVKLETKQLLLVHAICRHGARTPVDTYPNDPYINDALYPVGWGYLTNEGKLGLYELGKELRKRYDKFLGRTYTTDVYYSQSTDSDRTMASVQLVNAGLWEPDTSQQWGPLKWQPVPVHYEPLDSDQLLLVRKSCAQYNIELDRVIASEPIQELLKKYKPLFEYLSNYTGKSIKSFDDIQDLYTTLQAEKSFNLTLPHWLEGYFPEKMYDAVAFSYKLRAFNKKLVRLKGGLLLKKITEDINATREGTLKPLQRKFFLYGGHDSTVANLLSALGVFEEHIIDYGATILVEFYRNRVTKEYFVDLLYRPTTQSTFDKLNIPGCKKSCSLDAFLRLTRDHIPTDWEKECHTDDPYYVPPPPHGP